jgi:hypothetical protein
MRQENVVELVLQTRATADRRRTLAASIAFAFLRHHGLGRLPDRRARGRHELHGAGDAFLASLQRSNGALVHSTFLGGTGSDVGIAVAVGADRKRAFVTGSTSSTDFPSSPGAFDGSNHGAGDMFVASAEIIQGDE